jgi:hypothetical protein
VGPRRGAEQIKASAAWLEERIPRLGHTIYVEATANGPEIVAALRDSVPGIVSRPVERDKVQRAFAVTPQLEAGQVFLPGRAHADGTRPGSVVAGVGARARRRVRRRSRTAPRRPGRRDHRRADPRRPHRPRAPPIDDRRPGERGVTTRLGYGSRLGEPRQMIDSLIEAVNLLWSGSTGSPSTLDRRRRAGAEGVKLGPFRRRNAAAPAAAPSGEYGSTATTGSARWSGGGPDVNPALSPAAPSSSVYDEMALSDAVVRALLWMLELPIVGAVWDFEPASEDPVDALVAECCRWQFGLGDYDGQLDQSWQRTLRQKLLKNRYGCMFEEIVWGDPVTYEPADGGEPAGSSGRSAGSHQGCRGRSTRCVRRRARSR